MYVNSFVSLFSDSNLLFLYGNDDNLSAGIRVLFLSIVTQKHMVTIINAKEAAIQ